MSNKILLRYVHVYELWILVCMIKMTLSLSYNIPGLDVDNPITVCDKAVNHGSMPGGVVESGTAKQVPHVVYTP